MRSNIDDVEYWRQLANYKRTALRFEQQPVYYVGYEREQLERFLKGEPEPPTKNADLNDWYELVRSHVSAGQALRRVRIFEEPPTDYQRWILWLDKWNKQAGESIDYLPRPAALEGGVLPDAGAEDWWLFDDERLIVMGYDSEGRRNRLEMLVDEPDVEHARQLWAKSIRLVKRLRAKEHCAAE